MKNLRKIIIGIYKITFLPNNMPYIGQSIDILERFTAHKSQLKTNKHWNLKLQRFYNKYGKSNFSFEIIHENLKESELDFWEKFYIKKYNSFSDMGFNFTEGGKNSLGDGRKIPITLKNINTNEVFSAFSLTEFEKIKGLKARCLSGVFTGTNKLAYGWYDPTLWEPKFYTLIDPNEKKYVFYDPTNFAKRMNFPKNSISRLIHKKIDYWRGWRRPDSNPINKKREQCKNFKLQDPNGKIYSGVDIKTFCKIHNLNHFTIYRVMGGYLNHHKGWVLPGNPPPRKPSFTIFKLKGPDGKIYEGVGLRKFAREQNVNVSGLHAILSKKYQSYKGWTVCV